MIAAELSLSLGIISSVDTKLSPLGSLDAVCKGFSLINEKILNAVLIVGTQASLNEFYLEKFADLGILNIRDNGNPQESIKSFDIDAKGLVLGEGAAAILLESRDSAIDRRAKILAEIKSFSRNCDAKYLLKSEETASGLEKACKDSLKKANCKIDAVLADGCGLAERDFVELVGIAKSLKNPSITGLKANIGHMLGALGCTQVASGVMAIENVIKQLEKNLPYN